MTKREDEEPLPWPASRQNPLIQDFAAFAARIDAERAEAALVCDEILQGPSAWWAQRLRKSPCAKTTGIVHHLLIRMRTCLERSPADAEAMTALAVSVAEEVDAAEYPEEHVALVHSEALRDHAYVLCFRGDYRRALEVAERAEARIPTTSGVSYFHARLFLVQALILANTGRTGKALALARSATKTLELYGDRQRAANARMTEGIITFMSGAVEPALEILTAVANDPALDDLGTVRVAHNIGLCLAELHQHDEAVPYLYRSIVQFDTRGMTKERIRTQGVLAKSLLARGNTAEAIPLLRRTSHEFAELGLVIDAGIAALDLAEALLATHEAAEVPSICGELIDQFTRAGLASQAMTALAYLREAAELTARAPELVSEARKSLRRLAGGRAG